MAGRGLLAYPTSTSKRVVLRCRGQSLPPWDTHATFDRLALLLRRQRPRLIVALGDSVHDTEGAGRLPRASRPAEAMTTAHRFVGSGQPRSPRRAASAESGWKASPPPRWRSVIRPAPADAGRDLRPLPPQGRNPRARRQRGRPAPSRSRRLMMPAFGAYSGGLDVRGPAIARLFPRGGRGSCWARSGCSASPGDPLLELRRAPPPPHWLRCVKWRPDRFLPTHHSA